MVKRYYRKSPPLPDGVDRLDGAVELPMTEERLAALMDDNFRLGDMKRTVGYLILRHGLWETAMNLGLREKPRTAFRATWALEWAYEYSEDNLPEWFVDRMLDDFIASRNGSLHRVYGKMLCDRMRFGGFVPTPAQTERLAEKCFDLAIDPATKTAVTFWCLEILTEFAPRIGWVAVELGETVRRISESPDCTPGLVVACREILKRL